MDKKYKLIATDLDGTLLNKGKRISEKNMEAIKKATNRGIKFVMCSGRAPQGMRQFLDMLGELGKEGYYIASNGSIISDAATNNIIRVSYLPEDSATRLVKLGRLYENKIKIHVHKCQGVYVEYDRAESDMYEKSSKIKTQKVDDLLTVIDDKIVKILYIDRGDPGDFQRIVKEVYDKAPVDINMSLSSKKHLEFYNQHVDKGVAVETVAGFYGIPMEEVICIGDNYNDLPMIERAGLGICVANAPEDIKSKCKYVTSHTNEGDMLMEIYEKYL